MGRSFVPVPLRFPVPNAIEFPYCSKEGWGMIRNRTVFVLGAGASHEAGLPLGAQLAAMLRADLNFRVDSGSLEEGSLELFEAIKQHAQRRNQPLDQYVDAGRRLSRALASASSIDDAIHTFDSDDFVPAVGKMAIVVRILKAETESKLYERSGTEYGPANLQGSWYDHLSRVLFEQVRKSNIETVFQNVSFVNFNYDRSLIAYLRLALSWRFSIKLGEASSLLSGLKILNPYGSLGLLEGNNEIGYGALPSASAVLRTFENIRTFNEQDLEASAIADIRDELSQAKVVVFLGFGYHRQNLKIIKPAKPIASTILGTAYGVSDENVTVLKAAIRNHLSADMGSQSQDKSIFLQNKKCAQLVSDFEFKLSR
jgi:hypothetical protein